MTDAQKVNRQELRLSKVANGSEASVLAIALDCAKPGDLVVYHQGPVGSAPGAIRGAARKFYERGLCLLTQRITGDRDARGERIWDYIAVKSRPADTSITAQIRPCITCGKVFKSAWAHNRMCPNCRGES